MGTKKKQINYFGAAAGLDKKEKYEPIWFVL